MKLFFIIYLGINLTIAFAKNALTSEQVESFAAKYSDKHKIPKEYIKKTLGQAKFEPHSDQLKPATAKHDANLGSQTSWEHYRGQFIYPGMINKGAQFMCGHLGAIRKAKSDYGVPPEVILGIIGVETSYSENIGHTKVLDTLATIAFNSDRRVDFFQDELAIYILLCFKNGWDPTAMLGSIDGAFGITQFMPSSYLNYAVSYTKGIPNLMIADDAIVSIANYIKQHGWRSNEPVYLHVKQDALTCQKLNCNNRALAHPISIWKQNGVLVEKLTVSINSMADLISFGNLARNPAWLALNNFFVIYSYNHSNRYALTTYQLGIAVVASAAKLGCK